MQNSVWVGNVFAGPGSGTGISISDGHTPALHGNGWSGFSAAYGGAPPGPVLELPVRVLVLDGDRLGADLEIWNSGTESLSWSATTSSPWLQVTTPAGVVADENSVGLLSVEADPVGLEPDSLGRR